MTTTKKVFVNKINISRRWLLPLAGLLILGIGLATWQIWSIKSKDQVANGSETDHLEGLLHEKEVAHLGVSPQIAASGPIEDRVTLLGKVQLHPDLSAHVNPRYPGVVRQVLKSVGESVRAGETLAIVESNLGMQAFPLAAPMSGTVLDREVAVGEVVTEQTQAFAVGDLSRLLVTFTVYPRDIEVLKKGQEISVRGADGSPQAESTLTFIAPLVSEATRTATAMAELPNSDGTWLPGLLVTGAALVAKHEVAVRIPLEAISEQVGQRVVYVKADGGFLPKNISLGRTDERYAEVTLGLKSGDAFLSPFPHLEDSHEEDHDEKKDAAQHSEKDQADEEKGHDHDEKG